MKNSRRNTDIKAAGENLVTSMNFCSAADELLLESIIGFDSFAGCDNVSTLSTFSGKTFKTHDKKLRYLKPFPCLVKKSD